VRSTTHRRARRNPLQRELPATALLEVFDHLAGDGEDEEGFLFHLTDAGDDEHVELGVLPLRGRHPLDLLVGHEAPAGRVALGASVRGGATRSGDPDPTASPERVRVTLAITRTGDVASRVRFDDATVDDIEGPVEGLVADACLRSLSLPTPPPAVGTEALWTACWVDRVFAAWNDPATRRLVRSWDAVEALHPARRVIPDGDLVDAIIAHATRWSWSRILRAPTFLDQGANPTPAVLGWFDEGSLSRWLPTLLPPVEHLLADLLPLLLPHVASRLRATVDAIDSLS
jgi:hypothetical protein